MRQKQNGFSPLEAVLILVILGIVGFVGWYVFHAKNSVQNTYDNATQASNGSATKTPVKKTQPGAATAKTTPSLDKSVEGLKAANLYQKCETNVINSSDDWQESPASVAYRDFDGDNTQDVLVYAKLPGTKGYSRGCVYTMSSGALKQLWRLGDSGFLDQSDFSINDKNQIVYSGKQTTSGGLTDTFVLYQWSDKTKTFNALD